MSPPPDAQHRATPDLASQPSADESKGRASVELQSQKSSHSLTTAYTAAVPEQLEKADRHRLGSSNSGSQALIDQEIIKNASLKLRLFKRATSQKSFDASSMLHIVFIFH